MIPESGSTSFCTRMGVLVSCVEKISFMDRKGLKQAEIKNKVDWFFKSPCVCRIKQRVSVMCPRLALWRFGCLSPLLSQ